MNNTQLVACPHCNHEQQEPEGVVSTFCRSCGGHIKVVGARSRKIVRKARMRRDVECTHCGFEHRVAESSISTICPRCNTHLNLEDYQVVSGASDKIHTLGTVTFRSGGTFTGCEVRASRIVIGCKVTARLIAKEEAVLIKRARVDGKLEAPRIYVSPGANARVFRVIAPIIEVSGELHARSIRAKELSVTSSGYLHADKIICEVLRVHPGGVLRGMLTTLPSTDPTSIENSIEDS